MSKRREDTEFLLREYDQCWAYIKFHYEQRDRSQRFFFTFVVGALGLGAALLGAEINGAKINFPKSYIVAPIVILVVLGLFTLLQIISLRRTTILHHKAIVIIRDLLAGGDYKTKTPLWTLANGPEFFTWGFNFFTALIIIIITAGLAGLAVFIALFEWSKSVWCWSGLAVFIFFFGQSLLYWLVLKACEDKRCRSPSDHDRID